MPGRLFGSVLLLACSPASPAAVAPDEPDTWIPEPETAAAAEAAVDDSAPAPVQDAAPKPAPALVRISGDGSVVVADWPATDPLTVRYVDGAGAGVAGAAVTWKVETGDLGMNAPDSVTDADGYARARIRGAWVSPSYSFLKQLVSATVEGQRVDFRVTTMNDNRPNPPLNPHTQLESPRTIEGRVGTTIKDAVIVLVACQNGPSTGQPLSDVGVRISEGDAHCVGGTVLTNEKGRATCDLVLDRAGDSTLSVLIGGFNKYTLAATIKP